jgi:hypothetical protein
MEIKIRKMWKGSEEALQHLWKNFDDNKGHLSKKPDYTPTDLDMSAIYYLCNEWDYAYLG